MVFPGVIVRYLDQRHHWILIINRLQPVFPFCNKKLCNSYAECCALSANQAIDCHALGFLLVCLQPGKQKNR